MIHNIIAMRNVIKTLSMYIALEDLLLMHFYLHQLNRTVLKLGHSCSFEWLMKNIQISLDILSF